MKYLTRKRLVLVLIHLLVWVVLFSMPRFLFHSPIRDIHPFKQVYQWTVLVLFFYLNYYILIPRLLTRKKFLLYGIIILNMLLFSFATNVMIDSVFVPDSRLKADMAGRNLLPDSDMLRNRFSGGQFNVPPPPPEDLKQMENRRKYFHGFNSMIFVFMVLAVGTSIRITEEWYHDEKKRKEMETQKLSAELTFLKSQINPHFFFNTLNSIYSLASRKSDKTPEAIVKLSNLMRYIIYDSDRELVPLQNELDYIKNYVELQRLRLHENVSIVFSVSGDIQNKLIEPLLLLPFIENAFKHGIDYSKSCEIRIEISAGADSLYFCVENPVVPVLNKNGSEQHSGIGLANSRKRLLLLYSENHSLNITNDHTTFKVELSLVFKKPAAYV